MSERILVPMDDSEPAVDALTYALESYPDSTVEVFTVVDITDGGYVDGAGLSWAHDDLQAAAEERGEAILETARDIAAEHGVDIETEQTIGTPTRAIVDRCASGDFDAVVIGSHGREGAPRVLLGSVAEMVVRRSPIPVTVVR